MKVKGFAVLSRWKTPRLTEFHDYKRLEDFQIHVPYTSG